MFSTKDINNTNANDNVSEVVSKKSDKQDQTNSNPIITQAQKQQKTSKSRKGQIKNTPVRAIVAENGGSVNEEYHCPKLFDVYNQLGPLPFKEMSHGDWLRINEKRERWFEIPVIKTRLTINGKQHLITVPYIKSVHINSSYQILSHEEFQNTVRSLKQILENSNKKKVNSKCKTSEYVDNNNNTTSGKTFHEIDLMSTTPLSLSTGVPSAPSKKRLRDEPTAMQASTSTPVVPIQQKRGKFASKKIIIVLAEKDPSGKLIPVGGEKFYCPKYNELYGEVPTVEITLGEWCEINKGKTEVLVLKERIKLFKDRRATMFVPYQKDAHGDKESTPVKIDKFLRNLNKLPVTVVKNMTKRWVEGRDDILVKEVITYGNFLDRKKMQDETEKEEANSSSTINISNATIPYQSSFTLQPSTMPTPSPEPVPANNNVDNVPIDSNPISSPTRYISGVPSNTLSQPISPTLTTHRATLENSSVVSKRGFFAKTVNSSVSSNNTNTNNNNIDILPVDSISRDVAHVINQSRYIPQVSSDALSQSIPTIMTTHRATLENSNVASKRGFFTKTVNSNVSSRNNNTNNNNAHNDSVKKNNAISITGMDLTTLPPSNWHRGR